MQPVSSTSVAGKTLVERLHGQFWRHCHPQLDPCAAHPHPIFRAQGRIIVSIVLRGGSPLAVLLLLQLSLVELAPLMASTDGHGNLRPDRRMTPNERQARAIAMVMARALSYSLIHWLCRRCSVADMVSVSMLSPSGHNGVSCAGDGVFWEKWGQGVELLIFC